MARGVAYSGFPEGRLSVDWLKGFHDQLLPYGTPSVAHLRRMMLPKPGDSVIQSHRCARE
jgi:hypothetical protein